MGRKAAKPPIRPVMTRSDALDQLVEQEEHVGFGEALAHHRLRVGDLALAARHVRSVDQMHHDGDVAGLDEVEDVFAQPVEQHRDEAEAKNAAPHGEGERPVLAPDMADAITDAGAGAGRDDVGDGDAEIDDRCAGGRRARCG